MAVPHATATDGKEEPSSNIIAQSFTCPHVRANCFAPTASRAPLVTPLAQFAAFFYAYGVYLHFGFESAWISAHNTIINGSYEHYYHHAYSGGSTPLHTGFFFK